MAAEEVKPLVDCNSGSWRDWRNRLILAGGVDCESLISIGGYILCL